MAASKRALALILLAPLAGASCGGKTGPEDPAIAVGTGIPMGAPAATGASFEAPAAHGPPIQEGPIEHPPTPLPELTGDPFDPLEMPSVAPKSHDPPPIKAVKPPKKGMQL